MSIEVILMKYHSPTHSKAPSCSSGRCSRLGGQRISENPRVIRRSLTMMLCKPLSNLLWSRQSAIEMKHTHYFKDKISLTFSLTEQYLSKSLQIVVNTIIQMVALVNKNYLFSKISESYNERVIGTCSLNRRSPKMWTYGKHE